MTMQELVKSHKDINRSIKATVTAEAHKWKHFTQCQACLAKKHPKGFPSVFSLTHTLEMLDALTKWIQKSPLSDVSWFLGIMAYGVAINGVNVISMVMKVSGQRYIT